MAVSDRSTPTADAPMDGSDGRIEVDGCDTIPKLFWHQVQARGGRTALREKELGIWRATRWREYGERRAAGRPGAGQRSACSRGDVVSILAETTARSGSTPTWARMCAGGVTNGIYPTDSAKQVEYIVNDSGIALPVRRERGAARQVPRGARALPAARQGLRLRHGGPARLPATRRSCRSTSCWRSAARYDAAHPGAFERAGRRSPGPTTSRSWSTPPAPPGPPKGAMLSHRNILFQLGYADVFIPLARGRRAARLPAALPHRRAHLHRLHSAALRRHRQLRREHRHGAREHPRGGARRCSSPCRGSGRSSTPAWPSACGRRPGSAASPTAGRIGIGLQRGRAPARGPPAVAGAAGSRFAGRRLPRARQHQALDRPAPRARRRHRRRADRARPDQVVPARSASTCARSTARPRTAASPPRMPPTASSSARSGVARAGHRGRASRPRARSCCKGPHVFLGYYNKPEKTAETVRRRLAAHRRRRAHRRRGLRHASPTA